MKIKLSKGFYTIVDARDFEKLSKLSWHVQISKVVCFQNGGIVKRKTTQIKAYGRIKGKLRPMARVILNYFGKLHVDHINGNGLDNRRCNLRLLSRSDNRSNSANPDVTPTPSKKSCARIMKNGKRITLGTFKLKEEAIRIWLINKIKLNPNCHDIPLAKWGYLL